MIKKKEPPVTTDFLKEIVCFTRCFGQLDHLLAIELCTEYVGGN